MRVASEIKTDIQSRFEKLVGQGIAKGTLIDLYNVAISKAMEDVYQTIEDNKNPHIWSTLSGIRLDDMGTMLNIARKTGELDETYRYRIMNWVLTNEASNETAISDALLSPEYSSNISFYPYTKGSGTATCYVIPRSYDDEIIEKALQEAADKVSKIASPALHVEYVIPTIRPVQLQIFISSGDGDLSLIKSNLEGQIKEYINALAPGEYLEAGVINRMGMEQSHVDYFNVMSIIIDETPIGSIKELQGVDTKMLFDAISWTEGE